jgi:Zn-dependent protease
MKTLVTVLFGLLKAAKFSKFLLTGGTMLISVFAYALVFGWWYAVGFVALIFVPEMGHFMAARTRGLDVGAPTFIPFVGAWIQLKEMPHDAETEAYVGIAGPIAGSIGACIVYLLAHSTGSQLLLALAYSGFILNLFNLIPLSPLDGGRITAVISPRLWLLGVPLLAGLFFWRPSPLLILIAIMALPQVWTVFTGKVDENAAYYQASSRTRTLYAAQYLGLVLVLSIMSFELYRQMHPGVEV